MNHPKVACGCGDSSKDPYQESLQVVWHDPTSYALLKHGPSYMPRTAGTHQKVNAHKIAASVLSPKVARSLFPNQMTPLAGVLAILRAAAMVHQTHHWQTRGVQYYADHQLFERLYSESQDFIDQVAERAIGSTDPVVVNIHEQAEAIEVLVKYMCTGSADPEDMVDSSLTTESLVIQAIDVALGQLKASGELTNGTDNLLQGVSDLHEGFVYLLKQRSRRVNYDYGR